MSRTDDLTYNMKPVVALVPSEDIGYGDPDSEYVNLSHYKGGVTFALQVAAGAGTLDVTVKGATSKAGAGAAAIPARKKFLDLNETPDDTLETAYTDFTAAGFDTVANDDGIYFIHVHPDDMTDGQTHVCINVAQDDAGEVAGACVAYCQGAAYKGKELPSART